MKTIGLVGGLTWHSSVDYYRYINQLVNQRLGGDEAAKMILNSVNYGSIKKLTQAGNWDGIADIIIHAARQTVVAGADCILLGANTMHHIADRVEDAISVPLIHIADATARSILEKKITTVALLGTKYTMQMEFYRERLARHGIQALIPDTVTAEFINRSIYEELGKGIFRPETKQEYLRVIKELRDQGAGGVILGCTEIPLLIKQEDVDIPVFDTTYLHAKAAVDFALT
jgi:aspartate racemase